MSFHGPFLENPSALLLSSYRNAKRGIVCICEGLIFLGKATGHLLMFILFLAGLGFTLLVGLPLRLALYLFDWIKPTPIGTLPIFEPREKTS
jgi:hypothetical protein